MKNVIVGTAGHIDHGKTTLVGALTGIDTDRLKEEKRRGISIDLGFAHWEAGGVQFGFVDVPGHERFVRNMLAGAGGIDLVILVIAADESIKPQTREHFEICRLLGLRHGLIALTKADLADADMLKLAAMEAADFVAGSFLEGAPVVPVSSTTGIGLETLKRELVRLAAQVRGRDSGGLLRLPVDRSFTMKGFGTVVTGTLISGQLVPEQEVRAYPSALTMRVRGVQVHGKPAARALPGQRTAVNLAGVEPAQVHRGMVLAAPGVLRATQVIDARFELLRSAPPMKHRAPVHFHAGTAETQASVRLLESGESMQPGAPPALVRFILSEPLLLLPGDRFIVRMFSPVVTIGGGVVIDNDPPLRMRRSLAVARLEAVEAEPLRALVGEQPEGMQAARLVARLGIPRHQIEAQAARLGLRQIGEWLITPKALKEAGARLRAAVAAFHKSQPLQPGLSRAQAPAPAALLDALLAEDSGVAAQGEVLRLATHKLSLQSDEDAASEKMEALFRTGGLAVPAINDVLKEAGVDAARARTLLQILLRRGSLVRVSADLIFHSTAITRLKEVLAARRGQRFGVAEFKQWTGVSRKYAIPLLEYLDRERLTRREGDQRLVL